jgi:hypothetical protein
MFDDSLTENVPELSAHSIACGREYFFLPFKYSA